eukprot:gnl/TRDRNA2_/TRDRNA2_175860_c0_seq2.p1 gnl/TRDRNA2_/TRDRNA2_175860_c0~~gnl/TRDRNA2_/TRDRNA2_175860_c0_seq2.p1  ORF type:complete len:374 (-),score=55.28 gnl/TRDRNA2_/TRDRNA2_175860_c0_seq2:232-1353(-)
MNPTLTVTRLSIGAGLLLVVIVDGISSPLSKLMTPSRDIGTGAEMASSFGPAQPRACLLDSMYRKYKDDGTYDNITIAQLCPPEATAKAAQSSLARVRPVEPSHMDKLDAKAQRAASPESFIDVATCPVVFLTAQNGLLANSSYKHDGELRAKNVASWLSRDANMKATNVLYWRRDWNLIENVFATLQLPICFAWWGGLCGVSNSRGQLARWATSVLAAAYQLRFNHSCLVLVEDDIGLPDDFRQRLHELSLPMNEPRIMKFGEWGEGYVFNLKAAEVYAKRIYEHGVVRAVDMFVNEHMSDMLETVDVNMSLLTRKFAGDQLMVPHAGAKSFDYEASHDVQNLHKAMNAFEHVGDLDLVAVSHRMVETCKGA